MYTSLRAQLTICYLVITAILVVGLACLIFFAAGFSGYLQIAVVVLASVALIALGGLVFFKTTGSLTLPINRLREQTKGLDKGMPPEEERICSNNEIGELAQTIYEMAADLELQNRSVKYLAFHDALTGLSNRVNFQMQLEDRIVEAANHRYQCAVMYLDIDDFKEINDTRGHEYGDRALRTIANRLNTNLDKHYKNKKDKPPLLARIGGDEFTILVSGKLEKQDVAEVSESLLNSIAQPLEIDGDLFQLSGSIGVAFYPEDALSASSLFNSADMAMYASKTAGKGTYRFFTESMSDSREQLGKIKSEFKAALESPGELTLVYQPVVNIDTGRIVGAEALIRWNHPEKGPLYPDQFITVVEHNEIALATDLWVIEKVTALLAKIDLDARPDFRVSANISASNLGREQFASAVARQLSETPDMTKYLQLEVTETYLHRDEECAKRTLGALKETGVSIWLDDFCTGYSSLNHLCIFPVDGIKIDRKFVDQLSKNENNRLLVKALVSMTESFGIELIAEGLDNADDLHLLQKLGCHSAQGFLFSRPTGETEFLQMLVEDRYLM